MTLGIYIHIPFCRTRCGYCHFISMPMDCDAAAKYQGAVIREIEFLCASPAQSQVDSIYFGGGTPSLLPASQIGDLLSACRSNFSVAADCEISLEANPDTLTENKAGRYLQYGVNRVSLGAQTFSNHELAAIGRSHTSAGILRSLRRLRKLGFADISLDLMLGLPLQTAESWRENLEQVVRLGIPHISVYMLDLDDPCPLRKLVEEGSISLPDEELVSDLYLETLDRLASQGYEQYEISNFARPGFRCRHNLKYWTRAPVLGFGLGSHSFDGRSRRANYINLDDYLGSIEAGRPPVSRHEIIGEEQALQETLFLGLRLTQGINWDHLKKISVRHSPQKYEKPLRELHEKGLIEWDHSTVRLTRPGMLLANEVFQVFV